MRGFGSYGRGDAVERYHRQLSRELNGSSVSPRKEFEHEQQKEIENARRDKDLKDLKTL